MKTEKLDVLIDSYINGNISYVKEQVKKLSKAQRKELHQHALSVEYGNAQEPERKTNFFFNLI